MKKNVKSLVLIFVLLCCTLLISCTRNKPINYSIMWATGHSGELIIYECRDNGDKIYNMTENFEDCEKKSFVSKPETAKIKIYIKRSGYFISNKWVDQVYYLDAKKKNDFCIGPDAIISTTEP